MPRCWYCNSFGRCSDIFIFLPVASTSIRSPKSLTYKSEHKVMLTAILKFARLRVTIMLWALVFIGSASSGNINGKTILSLALLVIWYIHATTINDYSDYALDKINLKAATDRPLLSDDLSLRRLGYLHISSAVVALGLSFIYGKLAVALTLMMLLVDYSYSLKPIRLSDRGIIAQFVLAFAYVYYPISLGFWSTGGNEFPWILSLSIFIAFIGRMLLKDFRDVEGDNKHKKLTFLLRHGPKKTVLLSLLCWVLAAIIIGVAFRHSGIYIVLGVAMVEILIFLKILAYSTDHNEQQLIITLLSKVANALIITMLALLLCRHQLTLTSTETKIIPIMIGLVLFVFNWIRYMDYKRILIMPRSASTSTS